MGETIVSIVESATGGDLLTQLLSMSSAELSALVRQRGAHRFFATVAEDTAKWLARIRYLRTMDPIYLRALAETSTKDFAFQSAMAKLSAEEAYVAHAARIAAADAAATAAEGTLVAGAGTTAAAILLPVVAMAAVGVALGAPYYQAREEARKHGYEWGFAKGFVTGLLKWELRFTIDRFWDNAVDKNPYDEAMPGIRAQAHNQGLIKGRIGGIAKNDNEKKNYLRGMRKLADVSSANWTARSDDWMEQNRARNVQTSYVIEMAGKALKHSIITVG